MFSFQVFSLGGPPYKILEAWRDGKIQLLLSPAILEEYQRVMRELAVQFPEIEVEALIDFMIVHSEGHMGSDLTIDFNQSAYGYE